MFLLLAFRMGDSLLYSEQCVKEITPECFVVKNENNMLPECHHSGDNILIFCYQNETKCSQNENEVLKKC